MTTEVASATSAFDTASISRFDDLVRHCALLLGPKKLEAATPVRKNQYDDITINATRCYDSSWSRAVASARNLSDPNKI